MARRPGGSGKERGTNRSPSGRDPGNRATSGKSSQGPGGGALEGLRQGLEEAGLDPGPRREELGPPELVAEGRARTLEEIQAAEYQRQKALFAGSWLDPDLRGQAVHRERPVPDLWQVDPWVRVALLAAAEAAGWPEVRVGPVVHRGRHALETLARRRLVPQSDLEAVIEALGWS